MPAPGLQRLTEATLLRRGADLLVDELAAVTPAQVRHPGVLSGRGGLAYGLWRAGVARGDDDLIRAGLRWTELALAGHRRGRIWRPRPWSLLLGVTGHHFVRARIAATLGDRALRRASIEAFIASASRAIDRGSPDLYEGAAGALAAAAVLTRDDADAARALRGLGARLARVVLAELRRPRRRDSGYSGVAYGRGGLALAALEWSHASGRPLPAWTIRVLATMRDAPGRFVAPRSWCNGPLGLIPAWVRAYELTDDAEFLAAARAIATATTPLAIPTVCCGHPGAAYSYLALDRVDPGGGWRARAERSALAGLALEPGFRYRHPWGVTKGRTGVLCLALDLLAAGPAGVPGIQA